MARQALYGDSVDGNYSYGSKNDEIYDWFNESEKSLKYDELTDNISWVADSKDADTYMDIESDWWNNDVAKDVKIDSAAPIV